MQQLLFAQPRRYIDECNWINLFSVGSVSTFVAHILVFSMWTSSGLKSFLMYLILLLNGILTVISLFFNIEQSISSHIRTNYEASTRRIVPSTRVVYALARPVTSKELEGNSCGICMEETQPQAGSYVPDLPCGHLFCTSCLSPWIKREKYTCPMCRMKFDNRLMFYSS